MKNLKNKFTVDFMKEGDLISTSGNFSTVMKVRDNNGEIYCGKLPRASTMKRYYSKFPFEDVERARYEFNSNPEYYSRVLRSREHEASMAEKIYDDFRYTVKPEGAGLIKVEGLKDFYLPAFVNEFDSKMKSFEEGFQPDCFYEESDKMFRELLKSGFSFNWDSERMHNFLYSEEKGLKMIDLGMVNYKGICNPHTVYEIDNRSTVNAIISNTIKMKKERGLI